MFVKFLETLWGAQAHKKILKQNSAYVLRHVLSENYIEPYMLLTAVVQSRSE